MSRTSAARFSAALGECQCWDHRACQPADGERMSENAIISLRYAL